MTSGPGVLAVGRSPWLLRAPGADEPAVVCIPYAGMGASSFNAWPAQIADARVLPVQPPGHENRMREPACSSPRELAGGLAEILNRLGTRPLLFAAHCGGVPYALETAALLSARGYAGPMRLLASSWGAPHRDIYGPLNHRPLAQIDGVTEVTEMMRRRGVEMEPELAEIYAEVLLDDLRAMRGYRFDPRCGLPLPTTVLSWAADDVVPPAVAAPGWDDLGEVQQVLLDGPHEAFLAFPETLRALVADEVERVAGHVR
jgi:surfactin synthase thioesterase subunit